MDSVLPAGPGASPDAAMMLAAHEIAPPPVLPAADVGFPERVTVAGSGHRRREVDMRPAAARRSRAFPLGCSATVLRVPSKPFASCVFGLSPVVRPSKPAQVRPRSPPVTDGELVHRPTRKGQQSADGGERPGTAPAGRSVTTVWFVEQAVDTPPDPARRPAGGTTPGCMKKAIFSFGLERPCRERRRRAVSGDQRERRDCLHQARVGDPPGHLYRVIAGGSPGTRAVVAGAHDLVPARVGPGDLLARCQG